MGDDEVTAIVIDNGSDTCKAGLSGNDVPNVVIPTIAGHQKHPELMKGMDLRDSYVGHEVEEKRGILSVRHPIQPNGLINNWDDMEKIWHYIFHEELKVSPEEHSVLLTTGSMSPRSQKEKMVQIMFEKFNTPATYIAIPPVMSLYASGCVNGVVLDSGHGASYAVPIYDGHALADSIQRLDLAGRDIAEQMFRRLIEDENSFIHKVSPVVQTQRAIVRDVKEKVCYVAMDFEAEMNDAANSAESASLEKTYQLPDAQVVTIGSECFRGPELLFNPTILDSELRGIHEITYNSIKKCAVDLRKSLYENIVLSGGSTMFPGFAQRMQKEMVRFAPPTIKVKVVEPKYQDRKYTAWIGGSISSAFSTFQNMWITRAEYEDEGPSVVHRKCV